MADDRSSLVAYDVVKSAEARRRAPRRPGTVKKQVAVPAEVWERLAEAAKRAGLTPNDLIVRLAARALEVVERVTETTRLAETRWQAFAQADDAAQSAEAPSVEELVAAAEGFADVPDDDGR